MTKFPLKQNPKIYTFKNFETDHLITISLGKQIARYTEPN